MIWAATKLREHSPIDVMYSFIVYSGRQFRSPIPEDRVVVITTLGNVVHNGSSPEPLCGRLWYRWHHDKGLDFTSRRRGFIAFLGTFPPLWRLG